MKTLKIFIITFLLACPATWAQQEDNEDKDDELNLPEGMLENTDSLIAAWNLSQSYKIDTVSQLADVNPYFENAVYEDRLKRIPAIMDMAYNEVVQKYIDQYTGRLRHSVSYMLGASNFYVPIMEEALAQYQLPLELKYLPVIESAFNPRARSRVGAMGLWQFMAATGKRYGLEINSLVDERCNPIKASYAAARYLKDLYDIFGDWNLVIAAYNCGPNNINKAIHRAGGERDYWKISSYLPRETQGYVPAFIAANYVMNYYSVHNIQPMRVSFSSNTDTILVNRDVKMEKIASICNIDINELKALNPQYNTTLIPGYKMECILRMPQKQILTFIDLQDSIYSDDKMAERSLAQTADSDASPNAKTTKSTSKSSGSSPRYVTIRKGQTLSVIAKQNHTTVANLRRLNGIKGSSIRAGKKIRVR